MLVDHFFGIILVDSGVLDFLSSSDYIVHLVLSLIVLVVEGTSVQADNSSESFEVSVGAGKSNLCSKSVTSNGGHGNFFLVHKSDNVICHFL